MYSPLEHLAKSIWLGRYSPDNLMTVLHTAFFDASGKSEGYPALAVAGAVTSIKKWVRFESQWNTILERENIRVFHATDFASSQGEFKDWKDDRARRSRFLSDLKAAIKHNVNRLFMVGIETQAWNQVNREYMLEEIFFSPFALCGYTVVQQSLDWAKRKRLDHHWNLFLRTETKGKTGSRDY